MAMKLRIHLEIDALMDTRYGRLVQINENLKDEVLFKFGEYCNRDHDDMWRLFPMVSEKDWKDKVLDKECLKSSRRTNIFNLIDDVIRSSLNSPDTPDETIITLNTGRYDLTEAEIEMFKVIVSSRYDHSYVVESVSLPLDKLTPKYIKDNADLVIMYDFNEWTMIYKDSIPNGGVGSVPFYIPTIFLDKGKADREFFAKLKSSGIKGSPFEIFSDLIWEQYHLNVSFIANKFFSPISIV